MGLCRPEEDIPYMIATVEAKAIMAGIDDAIMAWEMKTPEGNNGK